MPHCLSTSKTVEVMNFDVSSMSSGIFLDPKIKPGRLDDRNPNRPDEPWEREILVQCFPLYSVLMALNNPHIDYFSLDIEGAEAAILKTVPWNQVNRGDISPSNFRPLGNGEFQFRSPGEWGSPRENCFYELHHKHKHFFEFRTFLFLASYFCCFLK